MITTDHLSPRQLSDRWGRLIEITTLANWRTKGRGPAFVKMFGRVFYPLKDVEAWEAENLRPAANDNAGAAGAGEAA